METIDKCPLCGLSAEVVSLVKRDQYLVDCDCGVFRMLLEDQLECDHIPREDAELAAEFVRARNAQGDLEPLLDFGFGAIVPVSGASTMSDVRDWSARQKKRPAEGSVGKCGPPV